MRYFLAIVLITGLAPQAYAARRPIITFLNGARLAQECDNKSDLCQAYVMGGADMMNDIEADILAKPSYCTPPGVSDKQLIAAFQNYAKSHPASLTAPAVELIRDGLREAFPCKE